MELKAKNIMIGISVGLVLIGASLIGEWRTTVGIFFIMWADNLMKIASRK